jgi:putative Mg2+ transporter-C (MgtC) family protein
VEASFLDLDFWRSGVAADLMRLAAAFVLAFPIAWDRERATRIMGMRTFSLVAVGACAYVLVGEHILPDDAYEARARIIQGLLSGIGFLGAGAILKRGDQVKGTATAALIWMTGALGAAVGYGQYVLALVLSAVTFVLLKVLAIVHERNLRKEASRSHLPGN